MVGGKEICVGKDITKQKYQICDKCTLEIPIGEYVLMHTGWNPNKKTRLKTEKRRQEYCDTYHKPLLELRRKGLYDYTQSYLMMAKETNPLDKYDCGGYVG